MTGPDPQGWSAPEGPPAPGHEPPGQPAFGAPPGWGGSDPRAPRPGVVPLRPLALGELLDGAVAVVRRYPRPTLGLSAAVALVSTAVGVVLLLLLPGSLGTPGTTTTTVSDAQLGGVAVGGLAATLVTGLAGLVLSGIITAVVGKAVLGEPMSAAQAWQAVRPLLGRLVGLVLLTGLLVVAPPVAAAVVLAVAYGLAGPAGLVVGVPLLLAAVVAAVVVYVRLSLAAPALVLERVGVREALRRSSVLVRRSAWRVFGITLLAGVVAQVVSGVLQLPFQAVSGFSLLRGAQDVPVGGLVLAELGAGLAQTLTAPFTSGVRALLYVDRRMRAEGLDVALAAAAASRG